MFYNSRSPVRSNIQFNTLTSSSCSFFLKLQMPHVYAGTIFVSPCNFYNLHFPVRWNNLTPFSLLVGKNNQIEKNITNSPGKRCWGRGTEEHLWTVLQLPKDPNISKYDLRFGHHSYMTSPHLPPDHPFFPVLHPAGHRQGRSWFSRRWFWGLEGNRICRKPLLWENKGQWANGQWWNWMNSK